MLTKSLFKAITLFFVLGSMTCISSLSLASLEANDGYDNYGALLWSVSQEELTLNENNGSYLSLSLNNDDVLKIKRNLEKNLQLTLKDRGEAHITIFNPIEWRQVKKFTTPEMLEKYFGAITSVNSKCIGMGEKNGDSTYFIIVEGTDLIQIRENLIEHLESTHNVQFNFYPYRPHITVGYTKDDLHYQDGVDKSKCWLMP